MTLGTDPELICTRRGQFVPAHNYFKSNSSFGLDGCESTAEIRPGWSESPIDMTSKIYQILQYGHEKAPDLGFLAGHYQHDYSIGGHLHFGIEPTGTLIDSLDVVMVSLSNCIDDRYQRAKRQKTGYGKAGAYRKKHYGFEYRYPGSFILTPATTLVTFTLAKLVALNHREISFKGISEGRRSLTVMKELKNNLVIIPEDCEEGLKQLDILLKTKLDWSRNILPFWGLEEAA